MFREHCNAEVLRTFVERVHIDWEGICFDGLRSFVGRVKKKYMLNFKFKLQLGARLKQVGIVQIRC